LITLPYALVVPKGTAKKYFWNELVVCPPNDPELQHDVKE